jgi:small subunit ribosomal protein S14
MAKTSKIAKNVQRQAVVEKFAARRLELKKAAVNPHLSADERAAAQLALQRLPRDASPTRLRNRDAADGRPRGYLRKFGISRVTLRDMAHAGELPGVTKSSW